MSGIAEVLLTLGYKVTGSDTAYSDSIRRLEEMGGIVHIGHQESHVEGAQVVVLSTAIANSNPEIRSSHKSDTVSPPEATAHGSKGHPRTKSSHHKKGFY